MPDFVIGLLADLNPASAISLALGVFAASLVPFFLLINADFASAWRSTSAIAREVWTQAAFTVAALLALLLPATGGT